MRKGFLMLFWVLATGCGTPGKEGLVSSVQQNSSPTGFVEGRVLDASDGSPVTGATVTTYADTAVTTTTDSAGHYRLGPIATGSYTVYVDGPGFLKSFFAATVGEAGSMFPSGNAVFTHDVDLSRPDAAITGAVLTNTGRIAKDATLYIDLRPSGFDLVASTKADAEGKFKFSGLPGSAFGEFVTVSVAPYDENGDGVPDYNNTSRGYVLFPGFTTFNTISLFALGVQLVTSNIGDGDLLPDEAVTLTFSGKIRTNQSTVTMFRNSGSVQVGTSLTWNAANTTATLKPIGGNLVEGQLYFVTYSVRADNGATTNSSIVFTARSASTTAPPGMVQRFRVVVPSTPDYDSGLLNIAVAWDMPANAGGYHLYGKDLASASAYLLVASIGSGFSTGATLNLSLFDAVTGDAFNTPLGYGNKITLAIVATDRAGIEGSLVSSLTLELADNVPPTGFSGSQVSGSANNVTGGAAAIVVYQVTFSEVMATDVVPQIVLPNPATSAVWSWVSANRGNFTITVPAGVDGRGQISVTGGKDTSANVQTVPFVGAALF